MTSARRTEQHTTTQTYRTNLRRIREMLGLTRDEATARIEPPKLTSGMLARVETGGRGLSVEELVQLSVAYQVPPAAILIPWSQDDLAKPPVLSGADYKLPLKDAQNWTLQYEYPLHPGAITRYGSTIQGAINARLYTNPATLLALSADPTPENYEAVAAKELDILLEPLEQAIQSYTNAAIELCGFNPFTLLDDHSPQDSKECWQKNLLKQLIESITTTLNCKLGKLNALYADATGLAASYSDEYGTNCEYSSIEALRHVPERIEHITQPLIHHDKLTSSIKYAYEKTQ